MILYPLLYISETSESQIFAPIIEEIILPANSSLVLGWTSNVRQGQEHIAAKRLRKQGFFGLEDSVEFLLLSTVPQWIDVGKMQPRSF